MTTFDEYTKPGGAWKSIVGWNDQGSFEALRQFDAIQRQNGCHGHVAEIGVHHGQFFVALALLCQRGEKALAIDVFDWQGFNLDRSGMGDEKILRMNIEQYCPDKSIVIRQADSLTIDPVELRCSFGKEMFRLVHVDGSHTTRHATNDLMISQNLIDPQGFGVVMVDDFFHPKWPGVTEAVLKYLNGPWPTLMPFAYDNKKIYLTGQKCRKVYFDHIRTLEKVKEVQILDVAGFEVACVRWV